MFSDLNALLCIAHNIDSRPILTDSYSCKEPYSNYEALDSHLLTLTVAYEN